MRFSIGINLERRHPDEDIRAVEENALELLLMVEEAGFEKVWVPEHHGIEMIVAPNPLVFLANWAARTRRIRLGTATIVAPYWHPLRLADEAALVDLMSKGRLALGIARGAFQYEFDRLAGGLPQERGGEYVREIVPLLLKLWRGDHDHDGTLWPFPPVTSVPKPVQQPHPPIWIGARSPETFGWAIENGLNIMSTPLQRPSCWQTPIFQTAARMNGAPRSVVLQDPKRLPKLSRISPLPRRAIQMACFTSSMAAPLLAPLSLTREYADKLIA